MPRWDLVYERALQSWESESRPPPDLTVAVLLWLLGLIDEGPPDDALPVPLSEDLFVSRIPGTDVMATYLALGYERRIVIRRFD